MNMLSTLDFEKGLKIYTSKKIEFINDGKLKAVKLSSEVKVNNFKKIFWKSASIVHCANPKRVKPISYTVENLAGRVYLETESFEDVIPYLSRNYKIFVM